ncbi:hypothetical protein TELCIR_08398 [Teladorsagia circumcincta]|uniref:Uncharacterized protein n=1 Tax=Teladorsagia circumcincta TaxID=45464 RepID=A0A2G9UHN6_TELCI|nr:hypothetical protein TELCIR_08398 [Teladorsagia circumcincta]
MWDTIQRLLDAFSSMGTKERIVEKLRELVFQCDQTTKACASHYFKFHPAPENGKPQKRDTLASKLSFLGKWMSSWDGRLSAQQELETGQARESAR